MVIDAGQTWRHRHNNQPVEVISASDGEVVFRRGDRKQSWDVGRFIIWYRLASESPKPNGEPQRSKEPKASPELMLGDFSLMVGDVWYSEEVGESCVIHAIAGREITFHYVTDDKWTTQNAQEFVHKHRCVTSQRDEAIRHHVVQSLQQEPFDINSRVDFKINLDRAAAIGQANRKHAKQAPTAEEMIRGAAQRVQRGVKAREVARAIRGASVLRGDRTEFDRIKADMENAMRDCEFEAECLKATLEAMDDLT